MRLMKKIRESIKSGTFVDFAKSFMLGMYPDRNYPTWSKDALSAVGILLE